MEYILGSIFFITVGVLLIGYLLKRTDTSNELFPNFKLWGAAVLSIFGGLMMIEKIFGWL